jgi:hypothetical protein
MIKHLAHLTSYLRPLPRLTRLDEIGSVKGKDLSHSSLSWGQ